MVSGACLADRERSTCDFYTVLDQILALLRQRGRVSYRALKRQFDLDDGTADDLKVEIIGGPAVFQGPEGTMLVWTGEVASGRHPRAYAGPPARSPTRRPTREEDFPRPAAPWKASASR